MQEKSRIKVHTDGDLMREWIDKSPRKDYNNRKMGLFKATGEDRYSKFHNWLYGYCRIPNPAKILMNEYSQKLTGDKIFPDVADLRDVVKGAIETSLGNALS